MIFKIMETPTFGYILSLRNMNGYRATALAYLTTSFKKPWSDD